MVCDEIAAMRVCSLKKLQSDSKLTLILSEAQKELVDSIPLMKLIIDCGLFIWELILVLSLIICCENARVVPFIEVIVVACLLFNISLKPLNLIKIVKPSVSRRRSWFELDYTYCYFFEKVCEKRSKMNLVCLSELVLRTPIRI